MRQPNETKTVQMPLKAESLAHWNTDAQRFVVERDKIKIMLGSSSRDIKLDKTINVSQD
jgi:beta-glucosidase